MSKQKWTVLEILPPSERGAIPAEAREMFAMIERTTACCCCERSPAGPGSWAVMPPAEAAALLFAYRLTAPFLAVCRRCSKTKSHRAIEQAAEATGGAKLSELLQMAIAAQGRK